MKSLIDLPSIRRLVNAEHLPKLNFLLFSWSFFHGPYSGAVKAIRYRSLGPTEPLASIYDTEICLSKAARLGEPDRYEADLEGLRKCVKIWVKATEA